MVVVGECCQKYVECGGKFYKWNYSKDGSFATVVGRISKETTKIRLCDSRGIILGFHIRPGMALGV